MYKCEICSKLVEKGIALNKKIISKRDKFYNYAVIQETNKTTKYVSYKTEKDLEEIKKNNKIIRTFSSKGWEIGEEIKVCSECISK